MELRRVAPAVGLGALLIVDAALITWALRPAPVEVSGATTSATVSPLPSGSVSPGSPRPTGSVSPTDLPLTVAPLTRTVAAVSDKVAWVADAGSCGAPGRVRVTTDGGATWSTHAAPGQVLRVRPTSATSAFITGGDDACTLRLWSSADGGASWSAPQSAARAWSRVPPDPGRLHLPDGSTIAPCPNTGDVIDLAPVDTTTALVLCAGGQVRATADGGRTWRSSFLVTNAMALGLSPDASAGVLVRTDATCNGVVAVPIRNGAPEGSGTCVPSTPRTGQVAVAGSATAWWLVVGDGVYVASSPDGPWSEAKGSLGS